MPSKQEALDRNVIERTMAEMCDIFDQIEDQVSIVLTCPDRVIDEMREEPGKSYSDVLSQLSILLTQTKEFLVCHFNAQQDAISCGECPACLHNKEVSN